MKQTYIDTINSQAREATIRLYGSIGGKVDGDLFAQELASLDGLGLDIIHLRLNTPGGDVFQGMSIISAMLSMNTPVYTHVDGVVASMGALIAVKGDRVYMMDFAKLMIHDAFFSGVEESELTPKQRKMLSKIIDMTREVLTVRGMDEERIAKLMKAETWFSAEEAKEAGLCDEIVASSRKFQGYTPEQIVAAIDAEYHKSHKIKTMEEIKLTAEALVALGITGEANEQAVSAAVVSLQAKYDTEKKRADDLQGKLDAQATAAAEALVADAVKAGKITADRKDSFLELAKKDYTLAKSTLDAIPVRKSIADEVKGIKAGSDVIPADRAGWTRLKWLKEDPKGLAKIESEHPEAFKAICEIRK